MDMWSQVHRAVISAGVTATVKSADGDISAHGLRWVALGSTQLSKHHFGNTSRSLPFRLEERSDESDIITDHMELLVSGMMLWVNESQHCSVHANISSSVWVCGGSVWIRVRLNPTHIFMLEVSLSMQWFKTVLIWSREYICLISFV